MVLNEKRQYSYECYIWKMWAEMVVIHLKGSWYIPICKLILRIFNDAVSVAENVP
jgi:hypothetical protein